MVKHLHRVGHLWK